MLPSSFQFIRENFNKHWNPRLPLWKIVLYDYVLLRAWILLLIPLSFWLFGSYPQETVLNIISVVVVPLFLFVVLSWVLIWRNTMYGMHKLSTYLLRGLVIIEALGILWFTEIATF